MDVHSDRFLFVMWGLVTASRAMHGIGTQLILTAVTVVTMAPL